MSSKDWGYCIERARKYVRTLRHLQLLHLNR
ncbi:DUF957 domain-containing protein [Escherichia coli]|nr:DUF957 domain-containing protein [Escherichia coli]